MLGKWKSKSLRQRKVGLRKPNSISWNWLMYFTVLCTWTQLNIDHQSLEFLKLFWILYILAQYPSFFLATLNLIIFIECKGHGPFKYSLCIDKTAPISNFITAGHLVVILISLFNKKGYSLHFLLNAFYLGYVILKGLAQKQVCQELVTKKGTKLF